jgi:DNA-binding MarR family transcriptional regulator
MRLARKSDPITSHASAAKAQPCAESEARDVLIALVHIGRGNSREIANGNSAFRFIAAKRLTILEERGLVERTGIERDPITNRECVVWRATDAGLEAVQR